VDSRLSRSREGGCLSSKDTALTWKWTDPDAPAGSPAILLSFFGARVDPHSA